MNNALVLHIIVTGIGATLLMDGWSMCQKKLLCVPPLNYGLVGRWLLWLARGKRWHNTILSTPSIKGESFTGWAFHYLTGMLFAAIPLLLQGSSWLREPLLLTGVLTGVFTLPAPWLIMQPALGFGIAASCTPRPWRARVFSLLTHLAYGLGLYGAALLYTF
ncbi:DUF2938 domain-containing protein [Kosakonia cowanii]|uniref:DUF2938 domain-containing protein n=1 Tax=Kosakonia cowanii TaxID=208223 RepID=UPI0028B0F461|nr:DUF2938 domain-containing protein [Kosakonia cowanii]